MFYRLVFDRGDSAERPWIFDQSISKLWAVAAVFSQISYEGKLIIVFVESCVHCTCT